MDTDYTGHSLVYSCGEDDMAYLWYLSRTPTVEDDEFERVKGIAADALPNFDFDNWVIDEQGTKKCKYPNSVSDDWELKLSLV